MIRRDVAGPRGAGERHFDAAILTLRQAQGEGDLCSDRDALWTIGIFGWAENRRQVDSSTLTLSLSMGEDGNAEMASEAANAILKARLDGLPPSAAPRR